MELSRTPRKVEGKNIRGVQLQRGAAADTFILVGAYDRHGGGIVGQGLSFEEAVKKASKMGVPIDMNGITG